MILPEKQYVVRNFRNYFKNTSHKTFNPQHATPRQARKTTALSPTKLPFDQTSLPRNVPRSKKTASPRAKTLQDKPSKRSRFFALFSPHCNTLLCALFQASAPLGLCFRKSGG